jgi:adenylate cyclase, class 2
MLEIELKFPVADFGTVEHRRAAWGVHADDVLSEADHYFNAPDRDFAKTDEAFRLRRIGTHNRITYKGPKQKGPAKTRTEIEVGLDGGDEAADAFGRLVTHLGYRPVAVVRKRRVPYHLQRDGFALEVCCDDVEELGRFVEVEIVAPPADRGRAEQVLLNVARALGLEQPEPRAYVQMLLARPGE